MLLTPDAPKHHKGGREDIEGMKASVSAPCRDCGDREPGCHGRCEKYQEYKKASEELREQQKREKDVYRDYSIARAKKHGR